MSFPHALESFGLLSATAHGSLTDVVPGGRPKAHFVLIPSVSAPGCSGPMCATLATRASRFDLPSIVRTDLLCGPAPGHFIARRQRRSERPPRLLGRRHVARAKC
ncbi:hypothetical protein AURDEDRAFT_112297 [Auricularia subglabra TFB-10046 SS5]|nr:hypothetical protein AURDEDRAFT_112297 [Auricularia subglabra TFB-10046 SS5]